jgi:flagellar hook-associated protein 2
MTDPTAQSIAYAVHIKESARNFGQSIETIGDTTAYSDNTSLLNVEYVPEDATDSTPTDFDIKVESFATPQINSGRYLVSEDEVGLEAGSYSFDMRTNKFHYELQFNINEGDTNIALQQKLARLINSSEIGVNAHVIDNGYMSALEVTSNSIGKPYNGKRRFNITDENTSYSKGVVEYLGLNSSIKEATNATYTINGKQGSSYSNSFQVHGAYHITLNPESSDTDTHIGLNLDKDKLSNIIEAFVTGYNDFIKEVNSDDYTCDILKNDMKKFLKNNKSSLSQYGISVNADSTMSYTPNNDIINGTADTTALKALGVNMLKKLDSIAINPMEYIDRRMCSYSNMMTTYPNPYVTSIYSGMLINIYI